MMFVISSIGGSDMYLCANCYLRSHAGRLSFHASVTCLLLRHGRDVIPQIEQIAQ